MAKLTKCDRCGVLEPDGISYKACLTSPYAWENLGDPYEHDLCVKCAADLRAFMKNEDVTRRLRVKED